MRRSLPEERNSYHALPHCLGAVGSATPAMNCLTAWGQWAVELLQYTASLPRASGQWNSCICNTSLLRGNGQRSSCNALPHCLWAVGSGAPALHRHTVWGQWAVQLLQRTASLTGGSGQCNSSSALQFQQCTASLPGDSGTPATHCLTAWGQWAVQLVQCIASLPVGSGLWNPCNALPHCRGQWGVQPLQRTASLTGSSGQCNSCSALPHYLGAVGSRNPTMRGPTSWGDGESCQGGGRCLKSGTPTMHCLAAW